MIKIKIIIITICLLCFTVPVCAENFLEVYRDDSFLIYVDTDSIEDRGEYLASWSKWIPRGENKKEINKILNASVSYTMNFSACNKKYKQMQFLSIRTYDSKNNEISEVSNSFSQSKYTEILPGSYADTVYECVITMTVMAEVKEEMARQSSLNENPREAMEKALEKILPRYHPFIKKAFQNALDSND